MREQFLNVLGYNWNKLLSHSASPLKIPLKIKNSFNPTGTSVFPHTKSTHFYLILCYCPASEFYATRHIST
jgi:hypothetical protein